MANRQPELTRRERQVLLLLCRGLVSDQQIAEALTISNTTAGGHVQSIMSKYDCKTRGALIGYAFRHHLVSA